MQRQAWNLCKECLMPISEIQEGNRNYQNEYCSECLEEIEKKTIDLDKEQEPEQDEHMEMENGSIQETSKELKNIRREIEMERYTNEEPTKMTNNEKMKNKIQWHGETEEGYEDEEFVYEPQNIEETDEYIEEITRDQYREDITQNAEDLRRLTSIVLNLQIRNQEEKGNLEQRLTVLEKITLKSTLQIETLETEIKDLRNENYVLKRRLEHLEEGARKTVKFNTSTSTDDK